MQLQLWAAHQSAAFNRCDPRKPLPDITALIRKLSPSPKKMSAKSIRDVIVNMAKGMGAEIVYVKKEDL